MRILPPAGTAATRIQANRTRSIRSDVTEPSKHGEVFKKVNHLVLVCKVSMKDERRWNHEQQERHRAGACPVAEQQGDSPTHLKHKRPDIEESLVA